jgi:hypothetical protein
MENHIIDDEELNFYLLLNDYVNEKGDLLKNTKIQFSMKTYRVKENNIKSKAYKTKTPILLGILPTTDDLSNYIEEKYLNFHLNKEVFYEIETKTINIIQDENLVKIDTKNQFKPWGNNAKILNISMKEVFSIN